MRVVIEVPLLRLLISVVSRRAVERLAPEERWHRGVAGPIGTSGTATGQINLRVDAGTIHPLMDHTLGPIGKSVHGLAGSQLLSSEQRKRERTHHERIHQLADHAF